MTKKRSILPSASNHPTNGNIGDFDEDLIQLQTARIARTNEKGTRNVFAPAGEIAEELRAGPDSTPRIVRADTAPREFRAVAEFVAADWHDARDRRGE